MSARRICESGSPAQAACLPAIRNALREHGLAALRSDPGLGGLVTARAALEGSGATILVVDGDWRWAGYLGGFEELFGHLIEATERSSPDLVTRHEQTLKRVWPTRQNALFKTPRDLTHSCEWLERTRFYHHEYQNKLLVGLAEFAAEALVRQRLSFALIIEAAEHLSPTAVTLLAIMRRRRMLGDHFSIVLVERTSSAHFPDIPRVSLRRLGLETWPQAMSLAALRESQRRQLYAASGGNPAVAATLLQCAGGRPDALQPLAPLTNIDLYLSTLPQDRRIDLARSYLAGGSPNDLIGKRNAQTLPASVMDDLHLERHHHCLQLYERGEGPLVIAHALAVADPMRRAEALVRPSEILMGIGLYDSWFSYFAPLFADPALRAHGSGEDNLNGLFINAAFILYAMGRADAALPFLEDFLERFPTSRFVPTALYAQSMTYGRYQIPVDLGRAEACALENLRVIDELFREHPRYTYIKVFAENAYAYIKARQGRLREALNLCEQGITTITEVYGDEQFRLHRSILIYNTSQVYELIGDLPKAELRLRDAIAADPFYAEYHNDLGNLLSRIEGRQSEALDCYQRAIDLSPPYHEAFLNRGILRADLADPRATSDFQRALDIKPGEWRAMRELGNLALLAGDGADALSWYLQAIDIQPADADLNANAAVAASDLGQGDLAARLARAALAASPGHAGAHTVLAFELERAGDIGQALEHAREAARADPDPSLQQNLRVLEARA